MPEILVRVVAPHFCAGLVIVKGRCIEAAPILKWAIGKSAAELSAYFKSKGWPASQQIRLLASDIPNVHWWRGGELYGRWLDSGERQPNQDQRPQHKPRPKPH